MSYYNADTKIHYGYIMMDEGTPNQQVRVLLATTLEGLETQAKYFGARLRRDDYCSVVDIDEFAQEIIEEVNAKNED